MPRFTGRPTIIEAHQFNGNANAMPDQFRMAVVRYHANGTADVMTGDGLRSCRSGDWIARGPSGQFMIWHDADFEAFFQEHEAPKVRKKEMVNV